MKRHSVPAAAIALGALLVPFAAAPSATAATPGAPIKAFEAKDPFAVKAGTCWRRIGPFQLQSQAARAASYYRSRGFRTSNVYGQGGVVSNWSNRRYFFRVFYRC